MTDSVLGRVAGLLTGRNSRRATVLGGAGLAVGVLSLPGGRAVAARQTSSDDFESGGLGLTSDAFDELYGPGEAGQGALIYDIDGESYAVKGVRGIDVTASINWFAPPQEPVDLNVALELISAFYPADSKLREIYTTPAAGIYPFATAYLYKSAGLARVLAGGPTVTSGNFLVAFQLTGNFNSQVSAANAFVGERPGTGGAG
ncbi:MAG TPA: hypothetical protein VKB09_00080 [Thermomicrobiales bacterium]|nr:hypothetical protein [Thermomicrobiales bacterium]